MKVLKIKKGFGKSKNMGRRMIEWGQVMGKIKIPNAQMVDEIIPKN